MKILAAKAAVNKEWENTNPAMLQQEDLFW